MELIRSLKNEKRLDGKERSIAQIKTVARLNRDYPDLLELIVLLVEQRSNDLYRPCPKRHIYSIPESFVTSSYMAQQAYLWMNTPVDHFELVKKAHGEATLGDNVKDGVYFTAI